MHRFIFFIGLLLGITVSSFAQNKAFSQVSLDFGSSIHIVNTSFTNNWNPMPGLSLGGRVSFYAGNLEIGTRITRYSYYDEHESGADFFSGFLYLGWEYPIKILPQLHISPGIRFGNNLMVFDKAKTYSKPNIGYDYTFDSTESEFSYELTTRLEYDFTNAPWKLNAALSYNRTLIYHPLPITLFSVGISRTFGTPRWLKKFLK